jgi:hypothetical protein
MPMAASVLLAAPAPLLAASHPRANPPPPAPCLRAPASPLRVYSVLRDSSAAQAITHLILQKPLTRSTPIQPPPMKGLAPPTSVSIHRHLPAGSRPGPPTPSGSRSMPQSASRRRSTPTCRRRPRSPPPLPSLGTLRRRASLAAAARSSSTCSGGGRDRRVRGGVRGQRPRAAPRATQHGRPGRADRRQLRAHRGEAARARAPRLRPHPALHQRHLRAQRRDPCFDPVAGHHLFDGSASKLQPATLELCSVAPLGPQPRQRNRPHRSPPPSPPAVQQAAA